MCHPSISQLLKEGAAPLSPPPPDTPWSRPCRSKVTEVRVVDSFHFLLCRSQVGRLAALLAADGCRLSARSAAKQSTCDSATAAPLLSVSDGSSQLVGRVTVNLVQVAVSFVIFALFHE